MKKDLFALPSATAVLGAITGVVLAEYFPKVINSDFGSSFMGAFNGPWSKYRNDLALQWGLVGLGIGLAAGIVLAVILKKK